VDHKIPYNIQNTIDVYVVHQSDRTYQNPPIACAKCKSPYWNVIRWKRKWANR